jgi:hypothetical protein
MQKDEPRADRQPIEQRIARLENNFLTRPGKLATPKSGKKLFRPPSG